MNPIILALLAFGAVCVGVAVVTKIGGWLVAWARRAIRAIAGGLRAGVLTLAKQRGEISAYALAAPHGGDLEVLEEITVDEGELSQDVLEALRRHGAVSERITVEHY